MENIDNFDYYIFGCGISGATLARKLINQNKDLKILIFEKREHIGGNVYDFKDRYGIMVHKYGPHIFHTNDDIVINFIKNYANWKQFRHKVNVKVKDIEVPLPINFKSIDLLFPEEANEIKEKLKKEFKNEEKTFIFDLISSENSITKKFGEFIYKNIFENYSKKM
jgi:UDP-galactopyranose mutase